MFVYLNVYLNKAITEHDNGQHNQMLNIHKEQTKL